MKKDQADLDAEEILDSIDYNGYFYKLIAVAVAAKLREKDDEIEKLREEIKRLHKVGSNTEKLDNLILSYIKNNPGAKFADIFDLDVKTECSKISNSAVFNLFRVADRRLQSLSREGKIKFKKGWYLK